MDSDINKNNVILTGEGHAIAKNYRLEMELLKKVNKNNNIRYLLAEMSYSFSCFVNEYLEIGDESKLKLVYNNLEDTETWSKESYNFWIELRNYNLSIPKNKRIKVVGIDIEHQGKTACEYLNSILHNMVLPKEIQPIIESYVSSYNEKNYAALVKAIENLQEDMKLKANVYSSSFGDKYFDFSIVVDNLVNSINAYDSNSAKFSQIREPSMYSNFKRICEYLPKGKYLGEFGTEHVYQRHCGIQLGNLRRFAMHLNSKDSPVKGKVLSIAYGYENCSYMNCLKIYCESKADPIIKDVNILDNYAKTNTTILNILL